MTAELPADLAAAYIRELSTDVRAVLPAPDDLPDGVIVLAEGVVLAAGAIAVVMAPGALWSPTALDLAAVAKTPAPTLLDPPPPAAVAAARRLLEDA
jgi:hypothetical protein